MNFPNFPRHEFSKENTDLLMQFLKLSKENKSNKNCNLDEYEKLKTFFPLQDEKKKLLKEYISKSVIDLTVEEIDSESQVNSPLPSQKEDSNNQLEVNTTTIQDLTYAIKENLEIEKDLPANIISQLNNLENLEGLFTYLSQELNVQAVTDFGKTLISSNINNNLVIAFYVQYLLLEKVNIEFTEDLGSIFNQFALKFCDILKDEISKYLLGLNKEYSIVFLQFLDKLDKGFKTNLLKMFLSNCNQFEENYIPLVETLLSSQTDLETLSKLVEVISVTFDHLNANKAFGKLLLNIVTTLGRHVHSVEPMLGHIIISHKSIWKSKIQNTYNSQQQDSQLFTQTFR